MPWNWTAPSSARGTPAEAAQPGAWPQYQDEVLLKTLQQREKATADLQTDAAKGAYLDKASRNFEEEADEALHAEFQDWLQGKHDANVNNDLYANNVEGAPVRRHIYGPKAGQPYDGWHHTPWRNRQLTHLSGVREHLRAQAAAKHEHELQMNFLAEHGPSNLQEAWMYFKHWVKQRPLKLGPQNGLGESAYDLGERSRGFNLPPDERGYQQRPSWHNTDGPPFAPPPDKPAPGDDDGDKGPDIVDVENEPEIEDLTPSEPDLTPSKVSDGEGPRIAGEIVDNAIAAVNNTAEAVGGAAEEAAGEAARAAADVLPEAAEAAEEAFFEAAEAEESREEDFFNDLFYDQWLDESSGLLSKSFENIAGFRIKEKMHRKDFTREYDYYVKQMMKEATKLAKEKDKSIPEVRQDAVKAVKSLLVVQAENGAFGASPAAQREWVSMLMEAAEHIAKGEPRKYPITKEMRYARPISPGAAAPRYVEPPTAADGSTSRVADLLKRNKQDREEEYHEHRGEYGSKQWGEGKKERQEIGRPMGAPSQAQRKARGKRRAEPVNSGPMIVEEL